MVKGKGRQEADTSNPRLARYTCHGFPPPLRTLQGSKPPQVRSLLSSTALPLLSIFLSASRSISGNSEQTRTCLAVCLAAIGSTVARRPGLIPLFSFDAAECSAHSAPLLGINAIPFFPNRAPTAPHAPLALRAAYFFVHALVLSIVNNEDVRCF